MDGVLPWLQEEMHWIKLDYIQAKRKSTIGVLYGSTSPVDREHTRKPLKEAVLSKIGQTVPMELKLWRIPCKIKSGKQVKM